MNRRSRCLLHTAGGCDGKAPCNVELGIIALVRESDPVHRPTERQLRAARHNGRQNRRTRHLFSKRRGGA